MAETKPIIIVEGGQYGSEGKGLVSAALCAERRVDFACRTGAVNAGHTVWHKGKRFAMQQLPTGWVTGAKCVIGPGALVHPDILEREADILQEHGYDRENIYIDFRAGLHVPAHTERSAASGRHYSMGATGKGCSEALIDRIRLRGADGAILFRDHPASQRFNLCNTVNLINGAYNDGAQILLEGTQGSLLDLYLGPYPYTTHKPTQAATWIQEMGLSPRCDYEIALVCRTYPIRVAGNSGPMPNEISWTTLARDINIRLAANGLPPRVDESRLKEWEAACKEVAADWHIHTHNVHMFTPEMRLQHKDFVSELHRLAFDLLPCTTQDELKRLFEFTTVTKKLRRVANWDTASVVEACQYNRPSYIVLAFANYWWPFLWGSTGTEWACESVRLGLARVEQDTGVMVRYITTGPLCENFLEVM